MIVELVMIGCEDRLFVCMWLFSEVDRLEIVFLSVDVVEICLLSWLDFVES